MESPKCRICGLRHWGACAGGSPTVAPSKPRRKAAAVSAPTAPAIDPPNIGARLRSLRTGRGESLAIAAAAIGCTKPHLWEIERGSSANPTLQLLRSLARHYGVTVAHIIGETA